jgi:hypothetical protein
VQVAGGLGSLVLSPDTSDHMMLHIAVGAEVCVCVGGVGSGYTDAAVVSASGA